MKIPENKWQEHGPEEDPTSRLYYSGAEVNGCPMHTTAIAVHDIESDGGLVQVGVNDVVASDFDERYVASGGFGKMHTIEIKGRDYVIFLDPFCN